MVDGRTRSRKSGGATIIRRQLSWLAFIGVCGLLIFACVSFTTLSRIAVNGPLYRHIRLSNHLVGNYVPPSQSLLEPALICAKLMEVHDPRSVQLATQSLRQFENEYAVRYDQIMPQLPEGPLKAMILGEAHETALEYFRLTDHFTELVGENRLEEARKLLVETMNPLYDRHAAAVNQIVTRADDEAHATEATAAHDVRVFTTAMAVIGIFILVIVCTLSWRIARGVSIQADRIFHSEESLRHSEIRYRTIFQTSRDALSISNLADGTYMEMNQAFVDLLGFEREKLIGHTASSLNIWADLKVRQNLVEMLRQNSYVKDEKTRLRRESGEVFWVLISASVMNIAGTPCLFAVTRDISDARAAEDEIKNLAFYDRVTRLPNRRLLSDRLSQALAGDVRIKRMRILLLVNLDEFATINNTLGHQAGDLLLQEVARRLTACLHEAGTVARFGADEFVVFCEATSEAREGVADEAKLLGETILAELCCRYVLDGAECEITASIGITVIDGQRESSHEVLKQAGIAMHQAKAMGGNTVRFFSPALQAAVNARAGLKDDLQQAINSNQFVLYYQPQVDSTGLIGTEALIRWNHPIRGLVPPYEFIPLAEETGLIRALGDWAFEEACKQTVAWKERNGPTRLQVAVNISSRQFSHPDFVENILATLARTGANSENLKLELTESMLADDIEKVIARMTVLKSHGLSFALDDFGTGYSSLSYLKRLPLDQLKIDRAFVSDILEDVASAAIAQTIISLGRAMGLSVIAEGVETEAQRAFLATIGAHSFQGYLFSRPLPLEEFERRWMSLS